MQRGASDLIRLIPALDQRRGLDVRCRNQADQNGISGRNHHEDFTRRRAFRQDAWPSRRFLFLAKIGFIKFWSILVLPRRRPAQIRVTDVKSQKKEYRGWAFKGDLELSEDVGIEKPSDSSVYTLSLKCETRTPTPAISTLNSVFSTT